MAMPACVVAVVAEFAALVAEVAAADCDPLAAVCDAEAAACEFAAAVALAAALAAEVAAPLAASCASTPVPRTITFLRPATAGAGGAATNVIVVPLIEKSCVGICATPPTNTTAALLPA